MVTHPAIVEALVEERRLRFTAAAEQRQLRRTARPPRARGERSPAPNLRWRLPRVRRPWRLT